MQTLLLILLGMALTLVLVWLRARLFDFPAQQVADYAGARHGFDIRTHLNGPMLCEGVIFGPTGRVTSRFVADMQADWQGNVGILKEHFRYDSGAEQHRQWQLSLGNDGAIRAEAADVVGIGTGAQAASGVVLKYRIKLPADAGGHELDTVDWMYLLDNGTIINRSQFRKYGIKVAELVATLRKVPA